MDGEERLPINQDPPIISQYYYTATSYLAQYGWFVLFGVVALYFLWKSALEPILTNLRQKSQLAAHKKYDASEIERRQAAMDAHRRRLQEEHDQKSAEHAAKQAALAEKRRQEKLEDWERHQSGQGYRSKVKKTVEEPPATLSTRPSNRSRLRDTDYSPLMGSDRSETSWRRERRGPSAGGG